MIIKENDCYIINTQGVGGREEMRVSPPPCRCGNIKNGIAFDIGKGGWVIDTADFWRLVEYLRQDVAAEAEGA